MQSVLLYHPFTEATHSYNIAGTRQHRLLEKIIASPFLLRDVGLLSPDVQTATLESYHAVVCHFAPKLNHFTFQVMQAKYVVYLRDCVHM